MKIVLLEASIILQNLKVLSTKVKGYQFIIPIEELDSIYNELNVYKPIVFESFKNLIDISIREEIVIVEDYLKGPNNIYNRGRDKIYTPLIANANYLKDSGIDSAIVTNMAFVENIAMYENIEVLDIDYLFENKDGHTYSPSIDKDIEEFVVIRNQNSREININILVATIVIIIGVFTVTFIDEIVAYLTIWVTFVLTIFSAIGLFVIREKFRLGYGIFEFFVGIMGVYLALPKNIDYTSIQFDVNFGFKILGGLYIMVRGLDNMTKGLQGKPAGNWLKEVLGIG